MIHNEGTPQQQTGITSPDTSSVSQFVIIMAPAEIIITFGRTRIAFNAENPTAPTPAVEWLMSSAMSAVTAKDLYKALGGVLQQYENLIGPIPDVPPAPAPGSAGNFKS